MSSPTYEELLATNTELLAENKLLKEKIVEIHTKNERRLAELAKKVHGLEAEQEKLRAELRKYNNENTPSASVPFFLKPEPKHRHKQSGQKEGHKGMSRQKPKIDRTEKLTMKISPCCGAKVKKTRAKPKRRTVTHLLLPKIENVEYIKPRYVCTCCSKEVQPQPPNTIPNARFDLNFMILLSVLSVGMNLPFGKIKELLKFLWGLDVSEATISNQLTRLGDFLGDEYERLKQEIRKASARNDDESGWRILGKRSWLWIFISDNVAYYTIEWSRGKKVVRKVLGNKTDGVDITDGLPSYNQHQSKKQKCWSHILRRFKEPVTYPFQNKREKKDFRRLRNSLKLLFRRAKADKEKYDVSVQLREKHERKLARILAKPYRGKNTEKIWTTVQNQKDELFTFLEFGDVEPTNNRAEQALKAPIVKRKISYQSRSMKHAQNYTMQLSIQKTAKLQGQDYAEVLQNIIQQQLAAGKF